MAMRRFRPLSLPGPHPPDSLTQTATWKAEASSFLVLGNDACQFPVRLPSSCPAPLAMKETNRTMSSDIDRSMGRYVRVSDLMSRVSCFLRSHTLNRSPLLPDNSQSRCQDSSEMANAEETTSSCFHVEILRYASRIADDRKVCPILKWSCVVSVLSHTRFTHRPRRIIPSAC